MRKWESGTQPLTQTAHHSITWHHHWCSKDQSQSTSYCTMGALLTEHLGNVQLVRCVTVKCPKWSQNLRSVDHRTCDLLNREHVTSCSQKPPSVYRRTCVLLITEPTIVQYRTCNLLITEPAIFRSQNLYSVDHVVEQNFDYDLDRYWCVNVFSSWSSHWEHQDLYFPISFSLVFTCTALCE